MSMKSQDILVLLKILLMPVNKEWNYRGLAKAVGLSVDATYNAIKRSSKSGLYSKARKQVNRNPFLEFIIYGIKYVFPCELGCISIGIPTAHSAPPLSSIIVSGDDQTYIWPYPKGKSRGIVVPPLYKSVPFVSRQDKKLYEVLALIDAIRVGKTREQLIAIEKLREIFEGVR